MVMAFRIMVFVLMFNIAAGIVNIALLDYYEDGLPNGIRYSSDYDTMKEFEGSAAAPGATGASGWWDKFMDFLKIGFFKKIIDVLDNSIYGITEIFQNLGLLNDDYNFYLDAAITIIYAIGIVDLWTGRRVTG